MDQKKPVIDFKKPVQTRDGVPVRILCTDGPTIYMGYAQPVVGVTLDSSPMSWSADGLYNPPGISGMDLINVPKKKKTLQIEIALCRDATIGDVYPCARLLSQPRTFSGGILASKIVDISYEE